jgi:uncharacterized protein YegP (UPF0339 family)
MSGYYHLKIGNDGLYSFTLKAKNHLVILSSQRYKSRFAAIDGIESVRANAALDERYLRKTAIDGSPYFVLLAANGQVIGSSQMYSAPAAMENGIRSVKQHAGATLVKES